MALTPKRRFLLHFWVFVGLSLIYQFFNSGFKIDEYLVDSYLSSPQFLGNFKVFDEQHFNEVVQIIRQYGKWPWYLGAFITDFIWAPTLLTLVGHTILLKFKRIKTNPFTSLVRIPIFTAVAALALFFDYWENLTYIKVLPFYHLMVIVNIKIIAYFLVLAIFLYYLFKDRIYKHLRAINLFFKTSYISFLIILIIVGLMTLLGQGSTLIVDLLRRPFNVAVIFMVLFYMAITLSHYPAYLAARLYPDRAIWCIQPFIKRLGYPLGFGLVSFYWEHYQNPNGNEELDEHHQRLIKDFQLVGRLRHYIGLVLLTAFLYVLLFVGARFLTNFFLDTSFAILVFVASIWFYNRSIKKHWYKRHRLFLFIAVGLIFLSAILAIALGWSAVTLYAAIVTILSLMVYYVFFRQHRQFSALTNDDHVNFIRWIARIGFISIIPIIVANVWVDFAIDYFNPINILLLYLSNFYGIIVIVMKHILYYGDQQTCQYNPQPDLKKRYGLYKFLLPAVSIFFVIWLFVAPKVGNSDLHELQFFPKKYQVSLSEYLGDIPTKKADGDTIATYYQVSSYGGGLKACLWNLLVLNELQKETNGDFINATLSMSGTSGGAMGIGNYAVLWANHGKDKDFTTLSKKITDIGLFDHLMVDVAYLFGNDFLRGLLPLPIYKGEDRSAKAMQCYAEYTGLDRLSLTKQDTSFVNTWNKIYDTLGYYPPIIHNSFSTSGRQGNVFPIQLDRFQSYFPGSINMIDQPACNDGAISYYGAMSTSNRFPIFSPAAEIKGKGHFLDGGYFDNSGLSTSLGFAEQAFQDQRVNGKPIRYVIIDNSTTNWIQYLLKEKMESCMNEGGIGEMAAILQGLVSLDKVPNYFESKIDSTYMPIHIYLPMRITYQDMVGLFKGEPDLDPDFIVQFIKDNNEKIEQSLDDYKEFYLPRWGIVDPPLARLNSLPAVRYQEAMAKYHPEVRKQINKIKALL